MHRFVWRNTGPTACTITALEAGCGCLQPEAGRRDVPAGETVIVTATVNTLTQPAGKRSWRTLLRYRTAAGIEESAAFTLIGEIVPLFSVTPPQVAFSTAGEARQTFVVTQADGVPFRIMALRSSSSHLSVAVGLGSSFEGILHPDAPVGVSDETIIVSLDHPTCRELRIPVKVLKRSATATIFTPEQPVVRFAVGAAEASTLVQLRSPQGKPLRILHVTADHPAVSFRYSPDAAGPALNLRILVASGQSGTATLTVKLTEETLTIPLTWTRP